MAKTSGLFVEKWIPAFAGMTGKCLNYRFFSSLLKGEQAARGIIKVTRHPFLVGVTIWAAAHILANGDVASLIMFGGFLALSLIGPLQIDAKRAASHPDTWPAFLAQTSWLPFAAMMGGRTNVTMAEIGWGRMAGGVALFLVILLLGHEWAFGVGIL